MPSTPPRPQRNAHVAASSSVSDTPYKAKNATSAPVIFSKELDDVREAVVEDVGPAVPQVTLQWFMDNIMPRLPPNLNIPAVVQELKNKNKIASGKWVDFSTAPADRLEHEDDVFDALKTVADAIAEAAKSISHKPPEPTVAFECRPRDTPVLLRRHNKSRPNGYGLYVKHPSYNADKKSVFWETIVVPWEVKKKERIKDINDNIAKILWSFHHIMRDDPSRRFVIGFTIENKSMRLWFGSRTDALVTDPFDFTREHETLAHFFLSLMYAKAHELGYDPTMQPARDDSKWVNQWDITVHYSEAGDSEDVSKLQTVTMRTEKLEASFGAEAMRSRGTRVWSGRILGHGKWGGKIAVLKDYWVEHDRLREETIRQKILDDAETDEQRDTLERHLLTPLCSGDVIIAGQRDTTHDLLRRGADVPTDTMYPTVHKENSSAIQTIPEEGRPSIPQGTGTLRPPLERARATVMLCDKSHHRIIFMEVANTIEKILSVHDVLDAGSQAAKALQTMHQCGWVHRDVSSGNILVVDGVVKISDLEYAKKMSDKTSHNGRSGTAVFMSVETLKHRYLFRPIKTRHSTIRRLGQSNNADSTSSGSTVPFRYNPLHDLESLWWVLAYLLLMRPTDIEDDTPGHYEKQLGYFDAAFKDVDDVMERLEMFKDEHKFPEGLKLLHARLEPVAKLLDWTRDNLLIQYRDSESKDLAQIDHQVGEEIASSLAADCEATAESFVGDADVKLCELQAPPVRKLNPEQPGAATAIGTSLDSRASGPKKRTSEEHGESSQYRRVRLRLSEEKKPGAQETQAYEGATQQVPTAAGVSVKQQGKGKGKA